MIESFVRALVVADRAHPYLEHCALGFARQNKHGRALLVHPRIYETFIHCTRANRADPCCSIFFVFLFFFLFFAFFFFFLRQIALCNYRGARSDSMLLFPLYFTWACKSGQLYCMDGLFQTSCRSGNVERELRIQEFIYLLVDKVDLIFQ